MRAADATVGAPTSEDGVPGAMDVLAQGGQAGSRHDAASGVASDDGRAGIGHVHLGGGDDLVVACRCRGEVRAHRLITSMAFDLAGQQLHVLERIA